MSRKKTEMAPNSRVVVAQPNTDVWEFENHWQKNLTDCCDNCGDCMCAFCCTICFVGKLFRRTGESCCMFCIPGSLMSLRTKLRTGFRIKGTICRDCCATSCCWYNINLKNILINNPLR